jgi:tRNA pseudouridine38-40 synthase
VAGADRFLVMDIADMTQRIAVGVEYDGGRYAGWQRQAEAVSVQAELERALGSVADHPVTVTCGGRTDAGVHALGQVAHFDTRSRRAMRGWALGANRLLPADIAVTWAAPVPAGFHARYSALARTYRYVILNRAVRPALLRRRVCWVHRPLDAGVMHAAAQCLVGEHDFSAFRAAECQSRTATRRLERIAVARHDDTVFIEVKANAFLHHMVRNVAGSLIAVGTGDRPAAWLGDVLAGRDRRLAGITAPASGLYFLRIDYPGEFRLPVPPAGPWAMIAGA